MHCISEESDLPAEGQSQKTVHLPNGETMQTTNNMSLAFKQLTPKAREADVLPHLQQSFLSVHKMSDNEYTTIFHPGNEGVTIHKPDTLKITMNKPPVL